MLDLNVNGPAKELLKKKFEEWYAGQVKKQLDKDKDIYNVDLSMKLSNMKLEHAHLIIGSWELFLKSWEMAGHQEPFTSKLPPEDLFADLKQLWYLSM